MCIIRPLEEGKCSKTPWASGVLPENKSTTIPHPSTHLSLHDHLLLGFRTVQQCWSLPVRMNSAHHVFHTPARGLELGFGRRLKAPSMLFGQAREIRRVRSESWGIHMALFLWNWSNNQLQNQFRWYDSRCLEPQAFQARSKKGTHNVCQLITFVACHSHSMPTTSNI